MTRPSSQRSAGVVGYLAELMTDTLDPGYAEAAARRDGTQPRRDRAGTRIGLIVVCVVVGLVLAVGYRVTRDNAPGSARARGDLIDRVKSAQNQAATLAAEANRLNGQVARAQKAAAGRGPSGEALTRAEELAGTVAVHGPGLVVTVGDPPEGSGGQPLTDLDVRAVVNALWVAGAEAITIDDVRLTPTSAIRFAGSAVLVDLRPVAAPYVIRAIGNANTLNTRFAVSDVAGKYRTQASAFGSTFTIAQSERLVLPAAAARQNRYAQPGNLTARPSRVVYGKVGGR